MKKSLDIKIASILWLKKDLKHEFQNELSDLLFPDVEMSDRDYSEYHDSKISISSLILDKEVELMKYSISETKISSVEDL